MPRTYARTVYGTAPGAGLAAVYALATSRFLSDNDQPDQLVLSLYGMLAVGMTAGHVRLRRGGLGAAGAGRVRPVDVHAAEHRRERVVPRDAPRSCSIHERRGPLGAPAGLDLAFSTPRAWLADGQTIERARRADELRQGDVLARQRHGSAIYASLVIPPHAHTRLRLRVPAGEHVARVVAGGSVLTVDRAGTIDLGDRHGAVTLRATIE